MFNLLILSSYTLRGKITWKQTNRILLLDFYPVTVTTLTFRHVWLSELVCKNSKTQSLKC